MTERWLASHAGRPKIWSSYLQTEPGFSYQGLIAALTLW
jgi:hypothetical protein